MERAILESPILAILVHIAIPILCSILLLSILKKNGAVVFWIVSIVVGLGSLLISRWFPILTLRYSAPLDGAGVETSFCSFSFISMAIITFLLTKIHLAKTVTVVFSSVVGIILLFLGSWIS